MVGNQLAGTPEEDLYRTSALEIPGLVNNSYPVLYPVCRRGQRTMEVPPQSCEEP